MIEYKCILFKEPISLDPKPDLKIVGYGLMYPVTADINDDEIMDDIRTLENEYDGHRIKVTMTFGLTRGNTEDVTALLRSADEKLYEGKTAGRNRIIL